MRWVTEVVKLNDDYNFYLGYLVLRAGVFTIRALSTHLPNSKYTHLNSVI